MATPLPETGFLRLSDIIGKRADPKRNIQPIQGVFPVSRAAWWAGIRAGRYPQGVKLGPNTTAWRVEDIRALIERTSAKVA